VLTGGEDRPKFGTPGQPLDHAECNRRLDYAIAIRALAKVGFTLRRPSTKIETSASSRCRLCGRYGSDRFRCEASRSQNKDAKREQEHQEQRRRVDRQGEGLPESKPRPGFSAASQPTVGRDGSARGKVRHSPGFPAVFVGNSSGIVAPVDIVGLW
jgi:hypothetical protein